MSSNYETLQNIAALNGKLLCMVLVFDFFSRNSDVLKLAEFRPNLYIRIRFVYLYSQFSIVRSRVWKAFGHFSPYRVSQCILFVCGLSRVFADFIFDGLKRVHKCVISVSLIVLALVFCHPYLLSSDLIGLTLKLAK